MRFVLDLSVYLLLFLVIQYSDLLSEGGTLAVLCLHSSQICELQPLRKLLAAVTRHRTQRALPFFPAPCTIGD